MIAKVIILFAALAAVNVSAVFYRQVAPVNTGVIAKARSEDPFGNYAFSYDIKNRLGAEKTRAEVGDAHGNKKGSFAIAKIDGRTRRVNYVADGQGFRKVVKTKEPGTAANAPAAALIGHDASYAVPPAVASPVAAPLALTAPLDAPIAYGGAIGHEGPLAPAGSAYKAPLDFGYGLDHGKGLIY
ncbi:adult-specific rigid cuticular protein 15.7 [Trichonephila inaurata madagascariensis]|uniref:Adult-specific rigid cuticular protein 15.7 n=1 Tax=Trichonephila inaurata madagascariensis TaxID=2747483 RepID=A0A8X7C6X9_9ARAC|nr:adult-specific rigid cuticular protein 15.7 [Trichonephila inaurata madagascariensis]